MDIDSPEGRETLYRIFRDHQVGLCVNSTAHDINNLLGAILSYAELVEMAGDLPGETARMVGQIGVAAKRCGALVQFLTDIARREQPDRSMLDIAPFVGHALDLRRHDFRVAQVRLEFDEAGGDRTIMAHAQKLQMALLYLLANALEAVADSKGAKVRVTLATQTDSVAISIWNSGPPVPEADRERIFEPFFTTKGTGHLGLGLTLARNIACEHNGGLTYDETEGFALRLFAL
jgi:signal transduction histidine kinase